MFIGIIYFIIFALVCIAAVALLLVGLHRLFDIRGDMGSEILAYACLLVLVLLLRGSWMLAWSLV